jgi:DNA-binding response OmpR family regulator
MAMVYGIVRQSGGTVTVASKPGKGTRVTILLPRFRTTAQQDEDASAARQVPTGSESILLVEDDHAVRTSIAHLLTESGYHVLQARDGEQAIRLARAHNSEIDLLISDIVMPGMSGFDAAHGIQKLHPETRTLFISGYPAKARAAAAGVPVLYKPFSRAVLGEKVRAILDRRSHQAVAVGARSQQERELP